MTETNTRLIKAKQLHQKAIVFDGHRDTVLGIMNHKRSLGGKSYYCTTGYSQDERGGS